MDVPDTDALVEGTGSDVLSIRRDSNSGNSILNCESKSVRTGFDIPESDSSVAGAGGNGATIAGEVKRVDILLVAGEVVPNGSRLYVPDLFQR